MKPEPAQRASSLTSFSFPALQQQALKSPKPEGNLIESGHAQRTSSLTSFSFSAFPSVSRMFARASNEDKIKELLETKPSSAEGQEQESAPKKPKPAGNSSAPSQ